MSSQPQSLSKSKDSLVIKIIVYVVCIVLAVISILPFWIMLVNATRSSVQIKEHPISLIPSKYLFSNKEVFDDKPSFQPLTGFINSAIISVGATVCALYFSSLTAYALTAYEWKLRDSFFKFIMAVMMIPAQCTMIGFFKMVYSLHLTNNLLTLILPAVAAPSMVFFMRQYLQSSLSMEIVQSARIDGAGEFRTFNSIVLPIMKPALATQAIFAFVGNWNELFRPLVILTEGSKKTMPIMVSLLNGDIYRVEYGAIYLGLAITVLPLIVVYIFLSKYIVSGVSLGAVK